MEALLKKIEAYGFTCEAGALENCTDWHSLCSALTRQPEAQSAPGAGAVPDGWTLVPTKEIEFLNKTILELQAPIAAQEPTRQRLYAPFKPKHSMLVVPPLPPLQCSKQSRIHHEPRQCNKRSHTRLLSSWKARR